MSAQTIDAGERPTLERPARGLSPASNLDMPTSGMAWGRSGVWQRTIEEEHVCDTSGTLNAPGVHCELDVDNSEPLEWERRSSTRL